MKLYYKTGACSLASRITLIKAGSAFTVEAVDTESGATDTGKNYLQINPKGYVPALELDNGEILTEGASILQYIADQQPQKQLTPPLGTIARARLHEYLNYTSSELHKAFSPLFSNQSSTSEQEAARENVATKFNYLEHLFEDDRKFLVDNHFTVADAYLFVVLNWSNFTEIDLSKWPNLHSYFKNIFVQPSVQQALKEEGLI